MSTDHSCAKVCVVGAGVVGLSTALRLLQDLQGIAVTLVADEFLTATTSDGAAGLWEPYKLGDTPTHRCNAWAAATYKHFQDLYDSTEAGPAGISQVPCIELRTQHEDDPTWKDIPDHFRHLQPDELRRFSRISQLEYTEGHSFTTMFCEGTYYLPWLTEHFLAAGGVMQGRRLTSLQELAADYDIVVNCAGLHGGSLSGRQQDTFPIRGHVIRVCAPWIKHAYFCADSYILPNQHNVVLGGTGDEGDDDLTPRQSDRDRIWAGCLKIMPSLAKATVEREWVGLRPGRSSVRLEIEHLQLQAAGKQPMRVVHNYGHGGGGITLHWGCAAEAVELVRQLLSGAAARPKL